MPESETFQLAKKFIEEKPACTEALAELSEGVEIRILLDQNVECACFYDGKTARIENRHTNNPDVQFTVLAEGLSRLAELPGDNMTNLGIEICREILAGTVKIKVVSSFWGILRNGYLNIIKKAGPDFMSFLATHGISNISKVLAAIKNMR